ncbi:ABC transporter permease [Rhodobium gokarnense]|uniref:Ribose transport system permease protein n=1 Tax=Rhodobium gokarnense TaxID=364296 RepID=A0ABT3HE19_9HYPH|nr:ABC transporter permease [Rhodobium gokarnense]MCW2308521.1 ribose transport system permease protein [Rhodobium gokarnense]
MSSAQALVDKDKGMKIPLKSVLSSRQFWLLTINAVVVIGLGIMRPDTFLSWINFKAVLSLMSYDLLLAIAMTTVLIVRGLDLSVGAVMALSSVVMALLLRAGVPVLPSVLGGLVVALACGFTNGFFIVRVGILPFLVTLAMMTAARGVATVLTTGQYISFPTAPRWFSRFARNEFVFQIGDASYGVPVLLIVTLTATLVFGLLLSNWVPLRRLFFIGQNAEAAKLSGIQVERLTIAAYMISAFFVWIAALLMTSANKIGYANYGITAEMRAIAAAVIGGASFFGGSGSIFGTFLGVLLLALIGNGFILLNGDPNWQQATIGVVLIVAVGIDALRTIRTRR